MRLKSTEHHALDGFTLVEILIVLVVIGFLAAVAVPSLRRARSAALMATATHVRVPVFFATDRSATSAEAATYGSDRSTTSALFLGRVEVSIPRDHQLANVERPTIWTLWREDPSKHFVIVTRAQESYQGFYEKLRQLVQQSDRKEVFVFVHGFNVSFDTAIYRTAQIAYDLGFDGAPVLYSWPSEGSLVRYPVDLNNNEWTIPHLRWFLEDLSSRSGASTIHIIAHSMGNRALVNALNQLLSARATARPRLGQVLLMAPDIDADTFVPLAQAIKGGADRVTLYASSNDEALKASKLYQRYRRAGDSSPDVTIVPGIDTVDVSALDTNLMGHSYYGDNRSVLSDVFAVLRDGKPPNERFGLQPSGEPPRQWWTFRP